MVAARLTLFLRLYLHFIELDPFTTPTLFGLYSILFQ